MTEPRFGVDMEEESNPPSLVATILDLLEQKKIQDALDAITDEHNIQTMIETAWDLLYPVCRCLTEGGDPEGCEDILSHLGRIGSPKELLVGFLEQLATHESDVVFLALLNPIQTVLLRLPGLRSKSLDWAFSTLYGHVFSLPLPRDYGFEKEERKLLDLDPDVQRIISILTDYLSFFEPFVQEVSIQVLRRVDTEYSDRLFFQRGIITRFLLKVMDRPLAYLDLSTEAGSPNSSSATCGKKVIKYLREMHADIFMLFDAYGETSPDANKANRSDSESKQQADDNFQTKIGMGTLAYLVFGEQLAIDNIPFVISGRHLFETNLSNMVALLSCSKDSVRYKGLILARCLTDRLGIRDLAADHLEGDFLQFGHSLVRVMIECSVEEYRRMAQKLLPDYISLYDDKGRCRILLYLMNVETHPGARGLVVQLFKKFLHEHLTSGVEDSPFSRSGLQRLLKPSFALPQGVETDLLEQSDCIMAFLNLLRYLVLSSRSDITGVWGMMDVMQADFIKPLRTALNLSRAHYELYRNEATEAIRLGKREKATNITVNVGGHVLPDLPADHQLSVFKSALVTFDLMESVLARLLENVNSYKASQNQNIK